MSRHFLWAVIALLVGFSAFQQALIVGYRDMHDRLRDNQCPRTSVAEVPMEAACFDTRPA
jgi:hypothetical protein